MRVYGFVHATPHNADQPYIFVPADGSQAELVSLAEAPAEVQETMCSQAEALKAIPLGVIVDLT